MGMLDTMPDRMPTVAGYSGRVTRKLNREPKEGSRLRSLYDLLLAHPGESVALNTLGYKRIALGVALSQLRDFYGMDVRITRHGSPKRGTSLYMLAGYWNGRDYTDLTDPALTEPAVADRE